MDREQERALRWLCTDDLISQSRENRLVYIKKCNSNSVREKKQEIVAYSFIKPELLHFLEDPL